jgi:glycosyltransferase involved in cell wall biosynthesis
MSIAGIENATARFAPVHVQNGIRLEGDRPRLLLLDAQADSVINFRSAFLKALVRKGYAVTVATPDFNPDAVNKLSEMGIRFHRIPFKRTGMNPFENIISLYRIYVSIRSLRPDFFIGVTIKPTSLGTIAARLAGVPNRFALLTGLGYAFADGREFKRRIANFAVRSLYKLALRYTKATIFQNDDDKLLFTESGLLDEAKAARVNGSGVDLARFMPAPFPSTPFTFLMISRLLEDKGVREYVAAARIIKSMHPQTRFMLVGARDQNPTAVTEAELQKWVADGVIEYGGSVADVRPAIAACHVFVLPSFYREGVPKAILEALAMGRPVITTRTPGCRETVIDGANGILVATRDVNALVAAELQMISSPQNLQAYGSESRSLAERKFDEKIVIAQLLAILDDNKQSDLLPSLEQAHTVALSV